MPVKVGMLRRGALFAWAAISMPHTVGAADPTALASVERGAEPRRMVISGPSLFEDYLRTRLPVDANVQVDDAWRSSVIFGEMGVGDTDSALADPAVYSNYCAYTPADALLFVQQSATDPRDLSLTIHRPGGVWQKRFPYAPDKPGAFLAMTREALACVADQCGLAPEERAALLDIGFGKDEVFRQYAISRAYLDPRGNFNPGEVRIRRLLTVQPEEPTNSVLAAEILQNADALHVAVHGGTAYSATAITLSQNLLPLVLGTPRESAAHAILRRFPQPFEKILLGQCASLVNAQEVDLDAAPATGADAGTELTSLDAFSDTGTLAAVAPTPGRACGALRLLGLVKSKKGLPLLLTAAKHAEASFREAAADGLAGYDDQAALDRLRALAGDTDERVACAAALGLWRHQIRHDRLLSLARTRTGAKDGRKAQALDVLEALGEEQDAPALRRLCRDPEPAIRLAATRGLIRLKALDDATLAHLLADSYRSVVSLALTALPAQPGAPVMAQVRRLANDPLESIAELARMSVTSLRPQDERGGIAFDLELEHTFVRLRQIERLCGIKEAWATELLDASCGNRDVYVRAAALAELVRRDPRRGHDRALPALSDASAWLRFAAAEALTKAAAPADAGVLRKALEREQDLATRLSLREALAKAEGQPPPAPPPAARSILGSRIFAWNHTGPGGDSARSPCSAYYEPAINRIQYAAERREGYAAGKIIFGRIKPETISNAGLFVMDRKQRESCWRLLDASLVETNLAYTDAFVLGDELMGMSADGLWPGGWRLFCLDAGLDPARIRGVQTNLTVFEQRAWSNWAGERSVDGFNALYDYVKWKIAKLRPGIQICTFLGVQGGPAGAYRRWKFDVGALRILLSDDTRATTYALVRQYKTLWPDRPVLCFGYGIVDPRSNIIQRGWKAPTGPLLDRHNRAYADAVTAYLAGADVGWWCGWVVQGAKWKEGDAELGCTLNADALYAGNAALSNAVEYAFAGAAKLDATRAAQKAPTLDALDEEGAPADSPVSELDVDGSVAKATREKEASLDAEKAALTRGLLFYGMYVHDCARVFADLPRQNPRPAALAVRPANELWEAATDRPRIPAMALLNQYDFLCDLNQMATLDLARYRFLSVHSPGTLLRDATLAALTRWLKEQPGLLYLHGGIATDNAAEDSAVGDMDGVLTNDWPWKADLTLTPITNTMSLSAVKGLGLDADASLASARSICTYEPRNESARVLVSGADGKPVLVLWRRPEFKGAVLFDGVAHAPKTYIEALRGVIAGLQKDPGIGLALDGPMLHEVLETTNLLSAACPPGYPDVKDARPYKGLDLLTGQLNPVVGEGPGGVMIGHDFIGQYTASLSGLAILASQPLSKIERIEGGVRMQNDGLVRVASESGRVTITPEGGAALPAVKEPNTWLILGTDEGMATIPVEGGAPLTYYRCARPVTITSK